MTDFVQTLQKHLDAVANRDLDALLATVSQKPGLTLVMPNGKIIAGFVAYRDFHQTWFADPDWTFSPKVESTLLTPELCHAAIAVEYKDLDREGNPYEQKLYLSLLFRLEQGHWLLVHDQNTLKST